MDLKRLYKLQFRKLYLQQLIRNFQLHNLTFYQQQQECRIPSSPSASATMPPPSIRLTLARSNGTAVGAPLSTSVAGASTRPVSAECAPSWSQPIVFGMQARYVHMLFVCSHQRKGSLVLFQTITTTFFSPRGTATQQDKVKQVIQEWYKYANINFKFVTNRDATIRIAFEEDEGSWSYVGRDNEGIPKKESTMNYGWVETGENVTVEDRSVILHEFGHCIGLLHEHQNSRRGEKITLDEAGESSIRSYIQLC